MKRVEIKRKVGMKPGKPPRRPGPPPAVSTKRRELFPDRDRCRAAVIDRDRGCVAAGIAGVPCGQIPGRAMLEVNELRRGSMRAQSWLEPDWCIAVCPQSHDWITGHPLEAQRRGLHLPSTATEAMRLEAIDLRAGWRAGANPEPSWFASPKGTM